MSLFQRHRWFVAAAGITLAFAAVCLSQHHGSPTLTAFADVSGLLLMLVACGVSLANLFSRPRQERSFWTLMVLGFTLWTANQIAWTFMESVMHRPIPDPFLFDVILFFHVVPMIAAVAWRPDLTNKDGRILLSVLNFLMLFGWWVFLYAFLVFPHQYVVTDVVKYNVYYDRLYGMENALLVAVLALAAWTSSGGWRRLYLHFLGASILYGVNSQLLDRAAADSSYYSGSVYDVPLIGTVVWMAAAAWSAREWDLKTVKFNLNRRWTKLVPRLAMLAILSLPVLGLWTVLFDKSPEPSRVFRIYSVLAAMLLMGSFVFLRQYLLDQALMALLGESRRAYDSQKQLQSQLVQQEKLASLGNLIAGAAQEIDLPLNAVMDYSEQFWSKASLSDEQHALVRKIVNQSRRTRDLIANLLSFARQSPGEKNMVDLSVLLNRASQMLEARRATAKIQVKVSVDSDFPRVLANANQLFQAFIEIIENAIDALEKSGGQVEITAQRHGAEVVLHFSDTGPGIRDPQRVFDPFYTTKPVGQGTGLGLSAVYGVVHEHGGQITCRNRPEGGALFVLRLPVTAAQGVGVGAGL